MNNYEIIENLGSGSFGSAFKVISKEDNKIYVIKKISLKEAKKKEINSIKDEAKILSSINSKYIVKYYDSFTDDNSFNIVMEYCNGLDLRKLINACRGKGKFIQEEKIYHFIECICKGISEIHKKKLIHRDIKPENLFLNENYDIKIGDFGIAKQLNNINEFAKTQTGTLAYMAPEVVNGEKYNNKVDIWALGCVIYELCTLNFCFGGMSIKEVINKITVENHGKIDTKLYSIELQKLIDLLLNKNYKKRPTIDEVIKIINNYKKNKVDIFEKILIKLFLDDEIFQNLFIEEYIQNSLDQISINIYRRERRFCKLKYFSGSMLTGMSIYVGLFFIIGGAASAGIFCILTLPICYCFLKITDPIGKGKFINQNSIIIEKIQEDLNKIINNRLQAKNKKNEKIIIYNSKNFENKIDMIKEKLIEKKLKNLKKIIRNNFNIILVGCTNAGKSTLINEFLKLEKDKRAKESEGGPTEIDNDINIYFKSYTGKNNNKKYTLFDSNGITYSGKDSIENKIKYTKGEIEGRIKTKDPNKLIHCIWYCIQGSNIQQADGDFIKELLNVYSTYSIPIIFVHTQTYDDVQSETCKKGLRKYLLQIFDNNEQKVNEYLNNYINILARGNKYIESFGLDKLEKITRNEIEMKGFKSSYFELIKNELSPILLNGAFNLIFTYYNINQLASKILEDLDKYLETILLIINHDSLKLDENIKNQNKIALNNLYNIFKETKEELKDELQKELDINNLRKNNEKFIKEFYENKSEEYKKEMDFKKFSNKVNNLIYDNISKESKKHINNIMNIGFNSFVIQTIKEGIKEQLEQKQGNIIKTIYTELFNEE